MIIIIKTNDNNNYNNNNNSNDNNNNNNQQQKCPLCIFGGKPSIAHSNKPVLLESKITETAAIHPMSVHLFYL